MSEPTKKKLGRPFTYRKEMCDRVIELGKKGKSITQIAAALGVSRKTVYQWVGEDGHPEFAEAMEIARTESQNWWEDVAQERMISGEPWNSATWIFNMKNRFGWRDKTEHSGDPQKPVQVVLDAVDGNA